MVCGCRFCGTLMVQEVHGLTSRCVCPACGAACDACLGTGRPPVQKGGSLPLEIISTYGEQNPHED